MNQRSVRKEILVISASFPYDSTEDPLTREFVEAINYVQRKDIPVIAVCDANAHNVVWGSTSNNPRGIALMEYLVSTEPNYRESRQQTNIYYKNQERGP